LRAELRQRGVAADLAQAVASEAPDAEDAAYRAAFKRGQQLAGLDRRTFTTRIGALLSRRGFDWETISPVVDRLWAEVGPGA
jgi:SOS response regulatory protein OraA/RecX